MSSKITQNHENLQAKCHKKSSVWDHQMSSKSFKKHGDISWRMEIFGDIWWFWVFFMIKPHGLSWHVMTYHECSWHVTNYFREVVLVEAYFGIDFSATMRQFLYPSRCVHLIMTSRSYLDQDKGIYTCFDGQYSGKYKKNTGYDVLYLIQNVLCFFLQKRPIIQ